MRSIEIMVPGAYRVADTPVEFRCNGFGEYGNIVLKSIDFHKVYTNLPPSIPGPPTVADPRRLDCLSKLPHILSLSIFTTDNSNYRGFSTNMAYASGNPALYRENRLANGSMNKISTDSYNIMCTATNSNLMYTFNQFSGSVDYQLKPDIIFRESHAFNDGNWKISMRMYDYQGVYIADFPSIRLQFNIY